MSDDLYLTVTEESLKAVQERLSRIDADDVHAESSMIQLI